MKLKHIALFEDFEDEEIEDIEDSEEEDDDFDAEDGYQNADWAMDKFMPDDEDVQNEYYEILDSDVPFEEKVQELVEFFDSQMIDEDRFYSYLGKNGTIEGFCAYLINKRNEKPANENFEENLKDEEVFSDQMSMIDDLKANFRSWEIDHETMEDAEELTMIMIDRHPSEDMEEIRKTCYAWVGAEEEL